MDSPLIIIRGERFPIAAPSDAAIGAIIDHETKRLKEEVKGLDALYVNLGTLSRNVLNAVSNESDDPLPQSLSESIMDDMRIIQETCKEAKIKCVFYHLTRKSFKDHFPLAIMVVPKTPKQIQASELTSEAIAKIIEYNQDQKDQNGKLFEEWDIIEADMRFDVPETSVVFMTSFPTDLVMCLDKISKAWCVQSFTGKLIAKKDFNKFLFRRKKYETHPAIDRIRFNPFFLQLFGDGGKLISPASTKQIETILDCAEKRNWTLATTKDKFRLDMELEGIWQESYASAKF